MEKHVTDGIIAYIYIYGHTHTYIHTHTCMLPLRVKRLGEVVGRLGLGVKELQQTLLS